MEYDKRIEMRYLLDLYFDGETTLDQERRLKELLAGDEVPADLEYAKHMFGFFGSAATDTCRKSVAAPGIITETLTEPETAGQAGAKAAKPILPRRRAIFSAISIAASLLLVAGISLGIMKHAGQPVVYCYVNGQPVTDVEYAQRQAKMASRIMEGVMKASGEGLNTVGEAAKPIEDLGRILNYLEMMGTELQNTGE